MSDKLDKFVSVDVELPLEDDRQGFLDGLAGWPFRPGPPGMAAACELIRRGVESWPGVVPGTVRVTADGKKVHADFQFTEDDDEPFNPPSGDPFDLQIVENGDVVLVDARGGKFDAR